MMYHKFLIGDTDRFDAANFPELQKSLDATLGLLAGEPDDPKAEMLLSFVKDHCMNSQLVFNYPRLASLISTKEVPLGIMEDLFESSRKNPIFRQALELHIRHRLHHPNFK
ncbi:hypothetical protein HRG84_17810 [Flavisolibacter sp. BT320]|nr:hypothetical protein [Flavisolibacter longurius]